MVAVVEHALTIPLQLDFYLPVNKLQESVLVHLVVEVIRLIGAFFEPWPWHL